MTASHSSSVMFTIMRSRRIPALLTRMSRRPKSSIACRTIRSAPVEVGDVLAVRGRLAAGGLDLLDDLLRRRVVVALARERAAEVVDDDLRAGLGERERVRAADPAAGTGDDRDLPLEVRHVRREYASVDFALTEEQQLIRETARAFCDREIVPHAREWDRSERMDRGIVAKLAEIGFLGCALPEEYGGMGLDTVSYCLVMEELGRADSSVRGIVSVNNGLAGKTIAKWGTEEQKAEWLPRMCSGEALGCYALTEPGSGSDPASLITRARARRRRWVLNGSKIFITLGSWAGVALVFARTGGEGARGITCFLVPTAAEGFSARKIDGKLGLRAQDTAELFLDDVRVPDSARLGDEGAGFKVAMSALDNGRISLAAGSVGHRARLPRRVDGVRDRAEPVRQGDRRVPARAGAARGHVRRDGSRAAHGVACGVSRGQRAAVHARRVAGEVLRERGGGACGERGGAGARRVRLRRRVPGAEVPARRARLDALRRHVADPEAADRPRADGRERVPVPATCQAASFC